MFVVYKNYCGFSISFREIKSDLLKTITNRFPLIFSTLVTISQIKKQTHYQVFKFSDTVLRIREEDEEANSYGISWGQEGDTVHLDVFCGMRGLIPRNIDDHNDSEINFRQTIEDLEALANITFAPYLIGTNTPKDILYFIDPS